VTTFNQDLTEEPLRGADLTGSLVIGENREIRTYGLFVVGIMFFRLDCSIGYMADDF
jgi:hypothetical protein